MGYLDKISEVCMRLINIIFMASILMLLIGNGLAAKSGPIEMRYGADITLDNGYMHGLKNGTAAQDAVTYSQVVDRLTGHDDFTISQRGGVTRLTNITGYVLSSSTSSDEVFAYWIDNCLDNYTSTRIIGTYTTSTGFKIVEKNYITIDADECEFYCDTDGITVFELYGCDEARLDVGRVRGLGINSSQKGIVLNGTAKTRTNIRQLITIGTGLEQSSSPAGATIDNIVRFVLIEFCNKGIAYNNTHIEGSDVRGNFIFGCCYSTYQNADMFYNNYQQVVAIDSYSGLQLFYSDTSSALSGPHNNIFEVTSFFGSIYPGVISTVQDYSGGWQFLIRCTSERAYFNCINRTSSLLRTYGNVVYNTAPTDGISATSGSNFYLFNSQNIANLSQYGCTLTDNGDGTFRFLSTTSDPILITTVSKSGKLMRYVVIKYKNVIGTLDTISVYWKTTDRPDYSGNYSMMTGGYTDGQWNVVYLDMWNPSLGGDDWKNSTISEIRLDLVEANDTSIDVAYILLKNLEAPGLT